MGGSVFFDNFQYDIQGPKIRTGVAKENTVLKKSKQIKITNKECKSDETTI